LSAGASTGTPVDAKCVTETPWGHTEVGRGTKFKFGQLILRKIIKIVATRCHNLRLICTKVDFGWGSAPDPAGGAHSAPSNPLTGFEGVLLLKEGKGMGWN